MHVEMDTEELVQAMMDDDNMMDALIDKLAEKMAERIYETTREEVADAFDYHSDKFRLSWMRMMEAEAYDLENSTIDNACDHGQKVYRGMFNMVRQFIKAHADELPVRVPDEVVDHAVQRRIGTVWEGSGYTVDTRPLKATIGEPQPAFRQQFTTDDFVVCEAASEPHRWGPSCAEHNPRRVDADDYVETEA